MNNVLKKPPLPLHEAVRRYWCQLTSVAIFPTVCELGIHYFHPPGVAFLPLFAATAIYADWPYHAGRAPESYRFVSFFAFGGGLLGMVSLMRLLSLMQAWFGSHHP